MKNGITQCEELSRLFLYKVSLQYLINDISVVLP